jgi:hypothetical protein
MRCMIRAAAWVFVLMSSVDFIMPAAAEQSQIEISYEEPSNAELRPIYERLKQEAVLEELREFLSPLRLPRKLTVRTAQCDATTRPYERGGPVTICYEVISQVGRLVAEQSEQIKEGLDKESLIKSAFIQSTLHGTALAIFDILEVPVWGREFDAADRLAAFIMTQFGEDTMRVLIFNTANLFLLSGATWTGQDFASTASPKAQRYYNYLCMAYAADPIGFTNLKERLQFLDYRRWLRCEREYEAVKHAFDLRIMPFIDPDLLVKIRATPWLR